MTQKKQPQQKSGIHEINNRLAAISLLAELMVGEGSAHERKKHAKSMLVEVKTVARLIAKG